MKILHVNYYDIRGGAAKAAYRLHRGLIDSGCESIMLVAEKDTDDNSIISAFSAKQINHLHIKQKIESALTRLSRLRHNFPHSLNIFDSWLVEKINSIKPDIVNLHWINGCMLSIKELAKIEAPIVWTLHDAWAYCGAEHHHVHGDTRYKNGYDNNSKFNLNRYVWQQKRKHWNDWDFSIIAPSSWLGQEAAESCIMNNKNVEVIHNGLDVNIFTPSGNNEKAGKKIIAFGAFDVNDWNKGGSELLEALGILRDKYKQEFELLLIGNGEFDSPFQAKSTGFIESDKAIAEAYSSADAFVLASKYDNLPNMLVEASACGVPLVGFETGGIPDIIKNKQNGYSAKAFDSEDLARGLNYVLDDENNIRLSKNAREFAVNKFDIKKVAAQYINHYKKILA